MITPDFTNIPIYIGIDTHLKSWTVTLRSNGIELKTFSMNPSAAELLTHLTNHYPNGIYHIVYEAGFCGFTPYRSFINLNVDCLVVNPADVPTSNKEKVDKKDSIDSRKLARELENGSLHGIYIPDVYHEQLRSLMRLRFRHSQNQTKIKVRIKMLLHNYGILIPDHFASNSRWSGFFINWLKSVQLSTEAGSFVLSNLVQQLEESRKHHKEVLRRLRAEAAKPHIAPVIKSLTSVPGIAFITAMTLITEIIDIKRFSRFDNLCSYIGLVPSIAASGQTEYSRGLSYRHNKFLRPMLIESAWTAVRKDPAMTLRYIELCKKMSKQKAIIRIAKKLLRRIKHVWITQENYALSLVV